MSPTTALAAKAALMNDTATGLFQTWPGLAGVTTTFGYPDSETPLEFMWLSNVTWENEEWANLNRTKRDEDYVIALWIDVRTEGQTQQETTARLITITGEVEAALRQDVRNPLGVPGVYQVELKPREMQEGVWPNGRWGRLRADIRVRARK